MKAKPRVSARRGRKPDDLAANEVGCGRNSLRCASMRRKIAPASLGIRGMSVQYRTVVYVVFWKCTSRLPGHSLGTFSAHLDHSNRRGGDLRGVGCRAGSDLKKQGAERNQSHGMATGWDA